MDRTTDPKSVSATEFKARCLELMDEVRERRISYLVTKRGIPVAELVPVGEATTSPIGVMKGTVLEQGNIVAPDHAGWKSGPDPLDAA